jgi:hypothetical protein
METPGPEKLEAIKATPFRQFADDHRAGGSPCARSGNDLAGLSGAVDYGRSLQLSYHDSGALERWAGCFVCAFWTAA